MKIKIKRIPNTDRNFNIYGLEEYAKEAPIGALYLANKLGKEGCVFSLLIPLEYANNNTETETFELGDDIDSMWDAWEIIKKFIEKGG